MAGCAADCSFWERYLGMLCRTHELRTGERISVPHASKLLANIFYNHRGYGLSAGTMIAGYDQKKDNFGLYMIDDGGERFAGDIFSVGSGKCSLILPKFVTLGSPYAYGVLDNYYKYDLSVEDAHELSTLR